MLNTSSTFAWFDIGRTRTDSAHALRERGGFTIEFRVRFRDLSPGRTLLDTRDQRGRGIAITTSNRFSLRPTLNDGQRESPWESDAGTHLGTLRVNAWQHVAVTVDGGPKIITWVVDGVLNDAGAVRDYGWGRFDSVLAGVNGRTGVMLAPKLSGQFKQVRAYPRPLRTSELVGNWRAATLERRP